MSKENQESVLGAAARVEKQEERFDRLLEIQGRMQETLHEFESSLHEYAELLGYYTSEEFLKDFTMDEEGLFPENLKRGVLSEDGVYNLIEDQLALSEELIRVSALLKQATIQEAGEEGEPIEPVSEPGPDPDSEQKIV